MYENTSHTRIKKKWYYFITDLLIESDEIDNWQFPFFKTRYSNGNFFEDLDPIISLINFNQTQIIKIIQDPDIDFNDFLSDFDNKSMLVITTNDLVENKTLIKNKIINFIKSQL
ncbi:MULTISPECIES: hypothetical protein [Orbaceae]|uniref:hypothetical protein n=1 Tax=Orbaceae TaxID=1240483 RepID=UPI001C69ED50|nr:MULTISPECIES: hypothetical protein [Orbaceae]MBX4133690.1 hypothetical protein [Frischella sp. Ac48]QYN42106.1 hypothetical protein GYM76_04800 [Gilliamella sp. ESL0443]